MTAPTKKGRIVAYDRTWARGDVLTDGGALSFSTTCFYGRRGQKHPSIGNEVSVVFTDSGDVLAVVRTERTL